MNIFLALLFGSYVFLFCLFVWWAVVKWKPWRADDWDKEGDEMK
jgi:hypothetical protein